MRKKWLIVGGVIGVVILVVATIAAVRFRKPAVISPLGETPASKAQLSTWEDPAGFKFSYPGEIKIDPHEEDVVNYAHLELVADGHPGRIVIYVKDTPLQGIEEWVKKEATGDAQIFDSELGGKPAKKIAYVSPKKLVVAALDIDVLVLVEVTPEDKWWEETYNQILSSFEFIPLAGEKTAPGSWQGTGGGGGVIEEEEEVVE